ncbi:MAG: nitrogen system component [Acetobacteraceae bacterium]|jgi:PTS system nitrogen regulatory IIA component|nr:nitrogen system component [Acetobacteraceae bacterium]
MEITDFLTPDRVILDLRARDKSHLIAEVARAAGRLLPALKPATIETALLAREQLGSTGLGAGFALPHARIEGLSSYFGLFVRLAKPIDFDAIDGRQVRLVFVLLIPAEAVTPHVAALAAISRRFRDAERVGRLEKADSPAQAHAILADR